MTKNAFKIMLILSCKKSKAFHLLNYNNARKKRENY